MRIDAVPRTRRDTARATNVTLDRADERGAADAELAEDVEPADPRRRRRSRRRARRSPRRTTRRSVTPMTNGSASGLRKIVCIWAPHSAERGARQGGGGGARQPHLAHDVERPRARLVGTDQGVDDPLGGEAHRAQRQGRDDGDDQSPASTPKATNQRRRGVVRPGRRQDSGTCEEHQLVVGQRPRGAGS